MSLVEAQVVEESRSPWGFWFTMLFSLIVLIVFLAAQTAVVIAFVVVAAVQKPGVDVAEVAIQAESNGLLLSLATWSSMLTCLAAIAVFVKLRRPWPLRDYLALRPASWAVAAIWGLAVIAFAIGSDTMTYLLGREVISQSMIDAYQTAGWPPLLWSALIVAAPVFEEVFFRGFMFCGLEASRLGAAGAILLTSLFWSAMHCGQYNLYQIGIIFIGGLLLGLARWRTGSVGLTIAMHSTWNLIATVEVWWYLNG